ncbi:unnamed protein product [Ilex paraguariensis]|uniref:Uncharacterized protein n=1 Tax=Ilex paraguariensis TaxID=185542 RepID=A0ABC8UVF6_9AQUA
MTEVLHSPSPSSSSSSSSSSHNDALFQRQSAVEEEEEEEEEEEGISRVTEGVRKERDKDGEQLSLLALLLTLLRKSFWVACNTDREELCGGGMEIGWPTNVRHVAHVTFDRFDGFLGLPVEFEPEVTRRAPSASATVFGVSTESMQLSYDCRGNSVPTILLLMQRHLYAQGGLQAEGIFRINAENSQEEYVRNQLNRGVVPEGIDVHCLAGLIKSAVEEEEEEEEEEGISRVTEGVRKERDKDGEQLSLLALLLTLLRKSFWVACNTDREELCGGGMEIGWPTNVRHVAHVTFDRFDGFLGLPVEFEPEVTRRAPSASATVFGVSTESMQLSYDCRGNSVPTILLLMQRHLYAQGGLQAEGIFRINAENSQEEYVRNQLNRGVVPEGIDVHCLAGLIKAWFRELPTGVLDSLSSEQVIQCQSEEDCATLGRLLPPTEAALLDWAINLMADVVQEEHLNKMNAHNIAMVFAPNMTQMADPLTALMYAVQVMNFLKTLIEIKLRGRENAVVESDTVAHLEPFDENGHQSPLQLCLEDTAEANEETDQAFIAEEPELGSTSDSNQVDNSTDEEYQSYSTFSEESDGGGSCETPNQICNVTNETEGNLMNCPKTSVEDYINKSKISQSSDSDQRKGPVKINEQQPVVQAMGPENKSKGIGNLSRINSRTEWIDPW